MWVVRRFTPSNSSTESVIVAFAFGEPFGGFVDVEAALDGGGQTGGGAAEAGPEAQAERGTSTSARLFSMARMVARATSCGERVQIPRGRVAPESANMGPWPTNRGCPRR